MNEDNEYIYNMMFELVITKLCSMENDILRMHYMMEELLKNYINIQNMILNTPSNQEIVTENKITYH